jgi:transcriptional regulator with PAS, ATPase and Fis domain
MLEGFAHLISVAIEKARGHEEIERMKEMLEGENLSLRQEVAGRFQFQNLIGTSSEMRRVLALIEPAARANSTVLITGENGTGKELVARILHHTGPRRKGPFVSVNCGAIPETLVESELFGILPNVATNVRARDGRFAQANGGTLFLDEIGNLSPAGQMKVLRVLQSGEFERLGSSETRRVDVRVLAATNADLRQAIRAARFREDLFFRLNVIELAVPPLRDRKEDILPLADTFLRSFSAGSGGGPRTLSPAARAALLEYAWPGNVRELMNRIQRATLITSGSVLGAEDLELTTRSFPPAPDGEEEASGTERHEIERVLLDSGGSVSKAASRLGVSRQALYRRMEKLGIVLERRPKA